MNLNELKHKYAYTLAKVGLNVQPGQTVLVEAALEGCDFTPVFAEECYKLGAENVVISYLDTENLKVRARYVSSEKMGHADQAEQDFYRYYLERGACYVRLEGVNPLAMESVPETEANKVFAYTDAVRNIMRQASRKLHARWLIAMIPTKQLADYILPGRENNLEELWRILLKLCYIDEENDVVETWKELQAQRNKRGLAIDALHLQKLHYTAGNGTDLTVGLTPRSRFGHEGVPSDRPDFIPFTPNIPSEEICTTPEKYATEGVVYASRPLVLGGKRIENFGFRFEKGKVTEVLAEEGKEMLEELIRADENAAYLGECALVAYHSPISMSGLVYYTTLIDENASCHLALGRGLGGPAPEGYTFNDSTIHVDFMIGTPDMRIVGTDGDGKEHVIFDQGDFAL